MDKAHCWDWPLKLLPKIQGDLCGVAQACLSESSRRVFKRRINQP